VVLNAPLADVVTQFQATNFVMWRPLIQGSIPVPLGQVTWGWLGHATLSNNTWALNNDSPDDPNEDYSLGFQASSAWPSWMQQAYTPACIPPQ
jgi:hypothetical protein